MLAGTTALSSPLLQISGRFPATPLPSLHTISLLSTSPFSSMAARPRPAPRAAAAAPKRGSHEGFWEDVGDEIDVEYEVLDGEDSGGSDEGDSVDSSAVVGDHMAVKSEHEELVREVELLLGPEERAILQQNEVADLSKISTKKWNPLHSYALSIQIPAMDKLFERGVDIDSVDNDGFTVLHKAIMGKKEAVISHLLRKGANPHVRDKDGATALHHAVQVGAIQTVKLLMKYKVDVNAEDNDGWTPLHLAIQCRSRDIAKVLLVNGADKTRRNKDSKTPMDISLCYGKDFKSYDLAKLLNLVPANRNL